MAHHDLLYHFSDCVSVRLEQLHVHLAVGARSWMVAPVRKFGHGMVGQVLHQDLIFDCFIIGCLLCAKHRVS